MPVVVHECVIAVTTEAGSSGDALVEICFSPMIGRQLLCKSVHPKGSESELEHLVHLHVDGLRMPLYLKDTESALKEAPTHARATNPRPVR